MPTGGHTHPTQSYQHDPTSRLRQRQSAECAFATQHAMPKPKKYRAVCKTSKNLIVHGLGVRGSCTTHRHKHTSDPAKTFKLTHTDRKDISDARRQPPLAAHSTQNYIRNNALKETTQENKMQIAAVRACRGEGLA